ncbi:MAG TPA: LysM domain-containing protein, partial [Candidatus Bathyarchaeia archaeon]|nr:LysM domain-containing protein [Candidatus Bathyarchaeia archaeon]
AAASALNHAASETDSATANEARPITHVVAKGETLSAIGRRYKVGVSEILAWNPRTSRNHLHPGQKLKIWVNTR